MALLLYIISIYLLILNNKRKVYPLLFLLCLFVFVMSRECECESTDSYSLNLDRAKTESDLLMGRAGRAVSRINGGTTSPGPGLARALYTERRRAAGGRHAHM